MPASAPDSARSSGPTGNGYLSSNQRSATTPIIRAWRATRSRRTCWVGWKAARRNPAPSASSTNSTGSSNRGSTSMSARHELAESRRELGTLEIVSVPAKKLTHRKYRGQAAVRSRLPCGGELERMSATGAHLPLPGWRWNVSKGSIPALGYSAALGLEATSIGALASFMVPLSKETDEPRSRCHRNPARLRPASGACASSSARSVRRNPRCRTAGCRPFRSSRPAPTRQ